MISMKRIIFFILFSLVLSLITMPLHGENREAQKTQSMKEGGAQQGAVFSPMAEPGKKVPIGNGFYLIYGFDKRPKLGTVIMKVEIFTPEGKKDTSFQASADAGMPSMKGAHESGDRPFTLSKKGDYLLPISIVMPGGWEIRLTISKDGKILLRGRYNFDV
jgi:hypothetical protein